MLELNKLEIRTHQVEEVISNDQDGEEVGDWLGEKTDQRISDSQRAHLSKTLIMTQIVGTAFGCLIARMVPLEEKNCH